MKKSMQDDNKLNNMVEKLDIQFNKLSEENISDHDLKKEVTRTTTMCKTGSLILNIVKTNIKVTQMSKKDKDADKLLKKVGVKSGK